MFTIILTWNIFKCHSYLCTEQLIHISFISKLRESSEISAVLKYEWHSGNKPSDSVLKFVLSVAIHCPNTDLHLFNKLQTHCPVEFWNGQPTIFISWSFILATLLLFLVAFSLHAKTLHYFYEVEKLRRNYWAFQL